MVDVEQLRVSPAYSSRGVHLFTRPERLTSRHPPRRERLETLLSSARDLVQTHSKTIRMLSIPSSPCLLHSCPQNPQVRTAVTTASPVGVLGQCRMFCQLKGYWRRSFLASETRLLFTLSLLDGRIAYVGREWLRCSVRVRRTSLPNLVSRQRR